MELSVICYSLLAATGAVLLPLLWEKSGERQA